MVIYDLVCDLGHPFEGWFANAGDYAAQQQDALICCPVCDSEHVEKKLSAPKIGKSVGSNSEKNTESTGLDQAELDNSPSSQPLSAREAAAERKRHYLEYQSALRTVHDYVEKNFDNVGSKFTEQAIAMQNGDLEVANIRGTATAKQNKELQDRGVTAMVLPRKPVDKDKLN